MASFSALKQHRYVLQFFLWATSLGCFIAHAGLVAKDGFELPSSCLCPQILGLQVCATMMGLRGAGEQIRGFRQPLDSTPSPWDGH